MKKFGEVYTVKEAAQLFAVWSNNSWFYSEPYGIFKEIKFNGEINDTRKIIPKLESHDLFYFDPEIENPTEDDGYIEIPLINTDGYGDCIDFDKVYEIIKEQDVLSGTVNLKKLVDKKINEEQMDSYY